MIIFVHVSGASNGGTIVKEYHKTGSH